ncbi:hypothetical protein [Psychromonas sp.]|uniref:hypothetical protein n=1 Tax=Psychromonas sp. TaxID=1884585 RepID=UPI0039E2C770
MRLKGSRYENSRPFSEDKHFAGYRERKLTSPPGLVEHTLLHTDRLDHLANDYYKKNRRWWRIMDANPAFFYGFDLLGSDFIHPPETAEQDKISEQDIYGDVIAVPAAREVK